MVTTRAQHKRNAQKVASFQKARGHMLRLGPGASRYYIEMRCLEIKEDGTLVPSSMKWLNRNFRHTSPASARFVNAALLQNPTNMQESFLRLERKYNAIRKPDTKADESAQKYDHVCRLTLSETARKNMQTLWEIVTEPNMNAVYKFALFKHCPMDEGRATEECVLCNRSTSGFAKCVKCNQKACGRCVTEWMESHMTCPFCRAVCPRGQPRQMS